MIQREDTLRAEQCAKIATTLQYDFIAPSIKRWSLLLCWVGQAIRLVSRMQQQESRCATSKSKVQESMHTSNYPLESQLATM